MSRAVLVSTRFVISLSVLYTLTWSWNRQVQLIDTWFIVISIVVCDCVLICLSLCVCLFVVVEWVCDSVDPCDDTHECIAICVLSEAVPMRVS